MLVVFRLPPPWLPPCGVLLLAWGEDAADPARAEDFPGPGEWAGVARCRILSTTSLLERRERAGLL